MKIFASDRKFVLVSFQIGHGQLLFQSGKSEVCPTRLSVLIKDARAMEIRSRSTGLSIEEVDPAVLAGRASRPDQTLEHGHKVFLLRGEDWEGYVIGGVVLVSEDQKEFMEPIDAFW